MTFQKRYGRVLLLLAFILSALMFLAACQDENNDDAPDQPAETTTEESADAPAATEPTATTPSDEPAPDATEPAAEEPATPEEPTAEAPTPADEGDIEDPDVNDEADTRKVLVYLVKNEEIAVASRAIAGSPEVATGAINELLSGTTPYEQDLGFSSTIPEGTRLLGINIQDGTATIDLTGEFESGGGSSSMLLRVAQIVFTLTQFNTVDQVRFHIDGVAVESLGGEGLLVDQPLNRGDFEEQSPAILVESPTPGDVVTSPINLRGTSNVFEATMQFEVIDIEGNVIYSDFGTATSGTGTRGTFNFNLDVPIETEGFGKIVVFESSAKDGSRINIVEIPVDLRH